MTALLLAILALVLAPLVIAIHRSSELFVIRIQSGRPRLVRGRLPQSLLDEITDIAGHSRIGAARLRVLRRSGQPALTIQGQVDAGTAQQLRNVIHRYGVVRIAAGGRRKR